MIDKVNQGWTRVCGAIIPPFGSVPHATGLRAGQRGGDVLTTNIVS